MLILSIFTQFSLTPCGILRLFPDCFFPPWLSLTSSSVPTLFTHIERYLLLLVPSPLQNCNIWKIPWSWLLLLNLQPFSERKALTNINFSYKSTRGVRSAFFRIGRSRSDHSPFFFEPIRSNLDEKLWIRSDQRAFKIDRSPDRSMF